MDGSGITLETVKAEMERRKSARASGQNPMAAAAPAPAKPETRPGGTIITDLLDKIDPRLTNSLIGGAHAFTTGKLYNPESDESLDRKLKESRIKEIEASLTTDEKGNAVKTTDVAREDREGRLRDFETRQQGGKLRAELIANPDIKKFIERRAAAQGMDAILQDALSRPDLKSKNVSDQALITLYNKILDPMSVVRETEYERTPEGQSLLNRIRGFYEKVEAGGSGLTDDDRREVVRAAKVLFNNQGELYNASLDRYGELTDNYGVPRNLVLTGFDRFNPYSVEQLSGGLPSFNSEQEAIAAGVKGKVLIAGRPAEID